MCFVVWSEGGMKKCIVEMDSLKVLNWIKGVEDVICSHANVVHDCQEWLNWNWIVHLQFVFTEGNHVVDSMAKLTLSMQQGETIIWCNSPERLKRVLQYDAMGFMSPISVQISC